MFKCKNCKNEIELFKDEDEIILVRPCITCLQKAGEQSYDSGRRSGYDECTAHIRGQEMGR